MSDQTTALSIHVFKPQQTFSDQRFPNALSLILRQHRNGSKAVPVPDAVRNRHGRKSNMPYDTSFHFRDERYREGVGRT